MFDVGPRALRDKVPIMQSNGLGFSVEGLGFRG